jgi:hypothetical protein
MSDNTVLVPYTGERISLDKMSDSEIDAKLLEFNSISKQYKAAMQAVRGFLFEAGRHELPNFQIQEVYMSKLDKDRLPESVANELKAHEKAISEIKARYAVQNRVIKLAPRKFKKDV